MTAQRPQAIPVNWNGVPATLIGLDRWLGWRYVERTNGQGRKRWTKEPRIAANPRRRASSTDPETWSTVDVAQAALEKANGVKLDGVGVTLGAEVDGLTLVGIDLDECLNDDGTPKPWAGAIIDRLGSYTEVSPSGRGVKVWIWVDLSQIPELQSSGKRKTVRKLDGDKNEEIEIYASGRYFTVTGREHPDGSHDVQQRTAELTAIMRELFGEPEQPKGEQGEGSGSDWERHTGGPLDDADVLRLARAARNGHRFAALYDGQHSYPSPSEGRAALLLQLAFWTGGDASQMDRLFRRSGLMSPKWDSRRGDTTLGAYEIEQACRKQAEHFTPGAGSADKRKAEPKQPPPPITFLCDGWGAYLERRRKRSQGYRCAPTGIPSLDSLLDVGLQPGRVTSVPGPTGTGKTSLASQIGIAAARDGWPVLFLSWELDADEVRDRMACQLAAVSWNEMRAGAAGALEKAALARVDGLRIDVVDGDRLAGLDAVAERIDAVTKLAGGAPLIIVDYLQDMQRACAAAGEDATRTRVDEISRWMRQQAKRVDAPVLALSSVSRAKYRIDFRDGKPDIDQAIASAKESGGIEYDSATLLRIDHVGESEGGRRRCWLTLAKNRGGEVGHVACEYDGLAGSFTEIDPDRMPDPNAPDDRATKRIDDQLRDVLTNPKMQLTSKTALAKLISAKRQPTFARINRHIELGTIIVDDQGRFRWSE